MKPLLKLVLIVGLICSQWTLASDYTLAINNGRVIDPETGLDGIRHLELFLAQIRRAREQGVDITTEVLPYNAGSTLISAAVLMRDWQTIFNITYEDVEWAATGERFNKEMWHDYQESYPGGLVIHHLKK